MSERGRRCKHRSAPTRLSVLAIAILVLAAGTALAQVPLLVAPQSALETAVVPPAGFGGGLSFFTPAGAGARPRQWSGAPAGELAVGSSAEKRQLRSEGSQRITLEQVKQQSSANRAITPFVRLGQLSIEAAKQHRLGVEADYYPKFGATFANLHYTEFLGQVLSIQRPLQGSLLQVPVPLFSQNQTIAALTFVQPITPLFQVYQLVKIARADERIAMAKAGVSVTRNARDQEVEETYFKLLIAQRRLTSADSKVRLAGKQPLYAAATVELVSTAAQTPELVEAKKADLSAAAEVKELTASLNRAMGWPDDTELELVPPDPLVENISMQDVADKPAGANPDVVEAEQTVVKARAASMLSKLAYVPTVAAVSGFLFQNAIPLVPNNFGYGGVMVSYNIFDFGKRERAVKEARAQLGMAEIALQLTKAKVADNVRKSYLELERSRQVSVVAQKMGSSVARLMNVSSAPESTEAKAARAEVEVEMLEADLAHRQAYNRLKALIGQP